ncbi:DUF4248 domain-containing protein [Bacteroides sp. 214]|uniref:DUF4248 domain-containing protein n=1 Tax=Bacteroides sp. 214 TaxID=2302935 RepID=UPI0013D517E5|nr:DUF4248 domain-containing protein [Bacteroides sp. 214]NDW13197.1 DUF4248 domain-containing protein [Bacteroides sp. 214]
MDSMINPIPIRSYSKGELAALYLPHVQISSARRTLNCWIRKNEPLYRALLATGYTPRDVLLTPVQVALIFQYLGEP